MTEPETTHPISDIENESSATADETAVSETDAEPPPEPWTPERVSEWNAYYDFYVKLAALLLVFMVSCNYVTDTQVWLHLKTGQLIAEQGWPIKTPVFSYTENGRPWLDIPWLFQWINAAIYKLVNDLVPVSPADPTANRATAEQIAIGTLTVVSALARLATAWLLLKLRHRGPGVWWSALVVTLSLGVVFQPAYGLMMGGIAGVPSVSPKTWGLLLFAFEIYLLFRAFCQGRGRTLWLLIPTFLLWCNIDQSFLTGLLVLAVAAVGFWLDGDNVIALAAHREKSEKDSGDHAGVSTSESRPPRPATALLILGVCALACLVNPFTYHAYADAISPYVQLFEPATKITMVELLSFFGPWIRQNAGPDWYLLPTYYVIVVLVGLASFFLNSRRWSWARFLPFAVMSVIWGIFMNTNAMFGVVFAAVVGPNGQEWYHDQIGTEGRLGRLWTVWSTGGRLVTLALIFLMIGIDITGWNNTLHEVQFGLGYNPDVFAFEAAEFLASSKEVQGNILNTSMPQGDALIWKGAPQRQSYLDSRTRFFPADLLVQWEETRKAISGDDVEAWKPLLDKYQISTIMIEAGYGGSPMTYQRLMQSPNWVPFYDDGRIVMFGRADAPASDLAFFKANRLDPDLKAYRTAHAVPGAERPPNPTSMIDTIFQTRALSRLHSRTQSARRWLNPASADDPAATANSAPIPEPARCLLAIQEARRALAKSPDDWTAYRILSEAYRYLMVQESAMLAGIPITPENANRIRTTTPKLELLMSRFQQRATVLNFAIQTTPPPQSLEARRDLNALNLELFQLYMNANAMDLARDRLQLVLDMSQPDDFGPEVRVQFRQQLDELDQQMKLVEDSLIELEAERQAGPVEQASFALSRGAAGRAISLLADAERNNLSPAVVKPRLIDLYCNTGQPDKALDLLSVGAIDDPNLGTEPGSGALRQGRVYFLLGNYLSAASLWRDRALPRVRMERSTRSLNAASTLVRGEAVQATNIFLTIPPTLSQQSSWEFDLAMCELEAGIPADASEHFNKALTLTPDFAVRPIAAYYLQKTGKPVPDATKPDQSAATPVTPATDKAGATQGAGSTEAKSAGPPPASTERVNPASPQPSPTPEKPKTPAPESAAKEKPGAP
jgi:tetratricopeptide (TPR) repeat protein